MERIGVYAEWNVEAVYDSPTDAQVAHRFGSGEYCAELLKERDCAVGHRVSIERRIEVATWISGLF